MSAVTTPRKLAASRCPSCGDDDLRTVGFPRETADGIALRRRHCEACGVTSILLTAWLEGELLDSLYDQLVSDSEEVADLL